jgi:N-acetylglutamate synthase-like GNAT family acetyltransferase
MKNELLIRKATLDDIPTIGKLAHIIWPVAYGKLLSEERMEYMLGKFYSPSSLKLQMTEQAHQFLMANMDGVPVGFASFGPYEKTGSYKLHKLYVRTDIQGKGLGRALIDAIIESISEMKARSLFLHVKRDNNALHFYQKLGFIIIREDDIDIGGGHFMNDYLMEKKL